MTYPGRLHAGRRLRRLQCLFPDPGLQQRARDVHRECRDYACCLDETQRDTACDNAPSDCGQVCAPYVPCTGKRTARRTAWPWPAEWGNQNGGNQNGPPNGGSQTGGGNQNGPPNSDNTMNGEGSKGPGGANSANTMNRRLNDAVTTQHSSTTQYTATGPCAQEPPDFCRPCASYALCANMHDGGELPSYAVQMSLSPRTSTMSRASCRTGIRCRGPSTRSLGHTPRTSSITLKAGRHLARRAPAIHAAELFKTPNMSRGERLRQYQRCAFALTRPARSQRGRRLHSAGPHLRRHLPAVWAVPEIGDLPCEVQNHFHVLRKEVMDAMGSGQDRSGYGPIIVRSADNLPWPSETSPMAWARRTSSPHHSERL